MIAQLIQRADSEQSSPPHLRLHLPRRRPALRMVRPSLLDLRFTGDPWIVDRKDGTFTLCLGDYCLVGIHGVTFDLPSLNQALDRLRNRRSRRRGPS